MIVLPKITRPNSGLYHLGKNRWRIGWRTDGKPRSKSFSAATAEEARRIRDANFEKLRQAGAITCGSAEHALSLDSRHIYRRPPYLVKFRNTHIGEFESKEEAKAALREFILVMGGNPGLPRSGNRGSISRNSGKQDDRHRSRAESVGEEK